MFDVDDVDHRTPPYPQNPTCDHRTPTSPVTVRACQIRYTVADLQLAVVEGVRRARSSLGPPLRNPKLSLRVLIIETLAQYQ